MAILEWFATCVETQPGVIEVLLNIRTVHDSASGHQVSSLKCFSFHIPLFVVLASESRCRGAMPLHQESGGG